MRFAVFFYKFFKTNNTVSVDFTCGIYFFLPNFACEFDVSS